MTDSTNEDTPRSAGVSPSRSALRWTLRLAEERVDGVLVLSAAGRIGSAGAPLFAHSLNAAIARGERALVVDLAAVDYLSSPGVVALDAASARLAGSGACLVLCGVAAAVRIVLDFADVTSRLSVAETRADAIARAARTAQQSGVGRGGTA